MKYTLGIIFIFICGINTSLSYEKVNEEKTSRRDCPWVCRCDYEQGLVDCSHQQLNRIPRGIPNWTRKLKLTGNFISMISYGSLQHLRELEELELDHNIISRLNAGMLRRLKNLRRLDLSRNRLTKMTKSPFRRLRQLRVLSLHFNKLQKLDVDTFKGLETLKELDISHNHLQTLETGMFEHMTSLTHLYVVENKWHCDCKLKMFEKFLRSKELKYGYVICGSPGEFKNQNLKDVHGPSICGPRTNVLIATLFGSMLGVMALIFAVFMCRKRAALNAVLEINGSNQMEIATPPVEEEDTSARSSFISVLFEDPREGKLKSHDRLITHKPLLKNHDEITARRCDDLITVAMVNDDNTFVPKHNYIFDTA